MTTEDTTGTTGVHGRPTVAASALLLLLAWPAAAGWVIEPIDAPPNIGDSSLRFTPAGEPAIAYGGDSIYYAVKRGGNWSVDVVAPLCVDPLRRYLSLAFDPADNPVIGFLDSSLVGWRPFDGVRWQDPPWLGFAQPTSGMSMAIGQGGELALAFTGRDLGELYVVGETFSRWGGQPVDSDSSAFPSVAFDAAGNPAVAYHGFFFGLKLARWDGAAWQAESIVPQATPTGLAFDAASRPVIAYQDDLNPVAKLASWNGTSWDLEVLDPEPGSGGGAIAFSAGGERFVGYVSPSGLKVNGEVVDPARSTFPSIAVGPDGNPAVSYYDWAAHLLKLATFDGSSWSSEVVETGGPRGRVALRLDAAGDSAVAYEDRAADAVRHGRWNGQGFDVETVDASARGIGALSYARDRQGRAAIAYATSSEARCALGAGAGWSISVAGRYAAPSVALADDGNPVVSLYGSNGLSFGRFDGSAWSIQIVDPDVRSADGVATSLALDRDGNPLIAYNVLTSGDIKLARRDGAAWSLEVVEPGSGSSPSLALDPAGNPAIAYVSGSSLKLARRDGAAWQLERVASASPLSEPALAFDAAGAAVVSFQGGTWSDLRFARKEGPAWVLETVDATFGAGSVSSLAFGPAGNPLIAYAIGCAGQVLLARDTRAGTLLRGAVASLDPGWKAAALPLSSANDDETAPFPQPVSSPGTDQDPLPGAAALTLYRMVGLSGETLGNGLRVAKAPGGVGLRF